MLASANSVLVTWLGDQLAQLQDDQRLIMVAIFISLFFIDSLHLLQELVLIKGAYVAIIY